MAKRFRLLSIDGGGIRGLIPAMVLAHLERMTGRPIHTLFDAVSGCSTGAVIAMGLVRPGAVVGDAERLVQLYLREAPKIFAENTRDSLGVLPRLFARWLGVPEGFDVNDLWTPRYASVERRRIFGGYFEGARLVDAKLPVLIPSYCTQRRIPVFFVSRPEHAGTAHTYYESVADATMLEAAMATTSAPTYFPAERLGRAQGGSYSLVDGSVYAANPTVIARAFLRDPEASPANDVILSLGTGSMQKNYPYEQVKGWGLASWAGPLLKMLIDGQCETTAVAVGLERAGTYLRMQGLLQDLNASDELDDCRATNLEAIQHVGTAMLGHYEPELSALASLLTVAESA